MAQTREEIAAKHRIYYRKNKARILEKNKAWWASNKEKMAEYKKEYHHTNKNKIASHRQEYREINKDDIAERARLKRERITRPFREYVWQHLKTHHCVDCGMDNPISLQYDHLKDKSFSIGMVLSGTKVDITLDEFKDEIDKCEVRCANCHTRVTAERGNWWKHRWSQGDMT